jgi:hypothetical protein
MVFPNSRLILSRISAKLHIFTFRVSGLRRPDTLELVAPELTGSASRRRRLAFLRSGRRLRT